MEKFLTLFRDTRVLFRVLLLLAVVVAALFRMRSQAGKTESSNTYKPEILPLGEIWKIEGPTDFVIALDNYVCVKCEYGDKISALSKPERVFFVMQCLEREVNNGGFSQFFFNSSGDYANEIVDACMEIGAIKTAEICKKAVSIYGGEVPADRDARDELLDDEANAAVLDECDEAFFEYEEDLASLCQTYALKNKEFFS